MIKTLVVFHIICGIAALIGLFGALGTKKGGLWHKRSGRLYTFSMALALLLAFIVSVLTSNVFLLFIAVFSAYSVYTGWRIAIVKDGVRSRLDRQLPWLMLLCACAMIAYGVYLNLAGESLGVVLSVFGVFAVQPAWADIKRVAWPKGKARIVLHLNRMGGASIATLTAVFVANVTTNPAFVAWLLPSLAGTPLIIYWSRKVLA